MSWRQIASGAFPAGQASLRAHRLTAGQSVCPESLSDVIAPGQHTVGDNSRQEVQCFFEKRPKEPQILMMIKKLASQSCNYQLDSDIPLNFWVNFSSF